MKIKNFKIYITQIALLTSAICAGCSLKNESEKNDGVEKEKATTTVTSVDNYDDNSYDFDQYPSDTDYNSSIIDNNSKTDIDSSDEGNYNFDEEVIEMEKLTESEKSLLNKKTNIKGNFSKTFQTIDNIDSHCKYYELFEIDAAIEKFNNSKRIKNNNTKRIIDNKKVDKEKLKKSIIENSDSSVSNNLIEKCTSIISDTVNYYLNKEEIDIDRLETKLEDLSISEDGDFEYASYSSSTGVLSVCPKVITILAEQEETSEDEIYNRIICHEVNHLLQAETKDNVEINKYQKWTGTSIIDYNLNVNSLCWDWYIEATADQMALDRQGYDESLIYSYDILALNGLKIATVFNEKNVEKLENLSISTDLNDLYEYFGCSDEKSKKEMLELFYKINLITEDSYTSSSAEFYDNFSKKKGYNLLVEGNEKEKFLYNVATSICLDESKMFYKNLIKSISNKNCKLEDIFYLISIEESEISRVLKYNIKEYSDDYKTFLEKYNNIQKALFDELSLEYQLDAEKIQDLYDRYYNDNNSSSIEMFNDDNSKFYSQIGKRISGYKTNSMHVLKLNSEKKDVKHL